jgi:hypothetical protein
MEGFGIRSIVQSATLYAKTDPTMNRARVCIAGFGTVEPVLLLGVERG